MKSETKLQKNLLLSLLLIFAIISVIYVTINGIICDFWVLGNHEFQFIRNQEIPLKEVWGPFSISSWMIAKLLLPFTRIFGTNQWAILLKTLDVFFRVIAVGILYGNIKSKKPGMAGVLGTLFLFLFLPAYLYSFVCHYTLVYDLIIISLVLFMKAREDFFLVAPILGGIAALEVLFMPQMIVSIPVQAILCIWSFRGKKPVVLLLYIVGGCALGGGVSFVLSDAWRSDF